jgi:hypothetical protein
VADGQEEACERIVSARDEFEHPPIFCATNQEELKHHVDPSKIDEWMTTASQIAIGSRRRVPENGPDVMNSERDSDNEQHGDEILDGHLGIKTDAHGNPLGKEHHMETSQAELIRRAAKMASVGREEREAVGARVSAGSG